MDRKSNKNNYIIVYSQKLKPNSNKLFVWIKNIQYIIHYVLRNFLKRLLCIVRTYTIYVLLFSHILLFHYIYTFYLDLIFKE